MRRLFIALFALAFGLLPGRVRAQNDIIKTFAGGGPSNLPAVPVNPNPPQTAANLNQPTSVAVDGSGNIYTASPAQHRVFKVDATGTLTVFAGNGTPGRAMSALRATVPIARCPYTPRFIRLKPWRSIRVETFSSPIRRTTSCAS